MGKFLTAVLLLGAFVPAASAMPTASFDDQAPVIQLATGPVNNKGPLLMATATDNVGVVTMNLYLNNQLRASSSVGTISYGWDDLPPGKHKLRITATDAANNTSTITGVVRVK